MLGVGGASAMAGRVERLMVARRPLVWAGLGRGRACLETPGEVWGEWLGFTCGILGHIGHRKGWEWVTRPGRKCKLRGEPI